MTQEPTLYAPVVRRDGDTVTVVFSEDHPGYRDPAYQAHRARIAEVALAYVPGGPVPEVEYSEQDHELWRLIGTELAEKHRRFACTEFLEGADRLALSTERVPQLADVSARLTELTGFGLSPAASLVALRDFYGSLAERRFHATQYVRHPSMPRFSPEPDVIHEIVGHGSALAVDRLADIYSLFGATTHRLRTDRALGVMSSIFWFTMEYGLIRQHGEVTAFGASLLSSCGELEHFRDVDIRPLNVVTMANLPYRVEHDQPVLFCADSFAHLQDFLGTFLTAIEDDNELAYAARSA
ncbi:MAG TPA: phenylalanine 4-monooxygenase [Actinophytocola sp.]|nr:phenylalanine 4-monooxygenase [Actinophytocola sp.]